LGGDNNFAERSSVTLGDLFDFVLLSDGITVRGFLGTVHDFISQTFRDGLHGSEGGISAANSHIEESDGDSSHGGNIDGLSSDGTTTTDSGGVFSGSSDLGGFDKDLDGVFTSHQGNDGESVLDDSDSLGLLTGISSVEHHAADESFNDGALGLSESLGLVSSGSVWNEDLALCVVDGDVILEADIIDLDFAVIVFAEKLELRGLDFLFFLYVLHFR